MNLYALIIILSTSLQSLAEDKLDLICSGIQSNTASLNLQTQCLKSPASFTDPAGVTLVTTNRPRATTFQNQKLSANEISIINPTGLPIGISQDLTVATASISVNSQNKDKYPTVSILLPGIINSSTTSKVSQNASNVNLLGDTFGQISVDVSGYKGVDGENVSSHCFKKAQAGFYGDEIADTAIKNFISANNSTSCDAALIATITQNAPSSLFCPTGLKYMPTLAPDDPSWPPQNPLNFTAYRKPMADMCQEVIYIDKTKGSCGAYPASALVDTSVSTQPNGIQTNQNIIPCPQIRYIPKTSKNVGEFCTSLNTPVIAGSNINHKFTKTSETQDYFCDGTGPAGAAGGVASALCTVPTTPISVPVSTPDALVACSSSACQNGTYTDMQTQFSGTKIALQVGETGSAGAIANIFAYDISGADPIVDNKNGSNGKNGTNDISTIPGINPITKYCIEVLDNSLDPLVLPMTDNSRKVPHITVATVKFQPIDVTLPTGTINLSFPPVYPYNYSLMKRVDPSTSDFIFKKLIMGR